jgi:hypothetical protein
MRVRCPHCSRVLELDVDESDTIPAHNRCRAGPIDIDDDDFDADELGLDPEDDEYAAT